MCSTTQALYFFLNELSCFVSFNEFVYFISAVEIIGIKLFINFYYYLFNFCRICIDVTSFISDIANLCSLSFFLIKSD